MEWWVTARLEYDNHLSSSETRSVTPLLLPLPPVRPETAGPTYRSMSFPSP